MSEWVETTLGDVLSLEYGKALPERERDGRGNPVYGSNGVVGYHSVPLINGPGIVVGRKGSAGSVTWSESSFYPIDTAYWVRLKGERHQVDLGYTYRLLQYVDLPNLRAQTGVPGLNRERAYGVIIALPTLPEQRRIVGVMSSVDAQIAALEAETEALEMAYTNGLTLLWHDGSGDEPAQQRLGDLMTLDVQSVRVAPEASYRIAGVLNAGKGLIARDVIRGDQTDYSNLNKLRAGQVVMRKLTAWEGPISVVPDEFDGFFASGEFPTFSLSQELAGNYFNHVCRSQRLRDEMRNRVTGSVQRRKRLNPTQLLDVALPIPARLRQETVAGALDAVEATVKSLAAELIALQRVRSDLLTALMSQEIAVDKAVDQFMEGAE
jgi:restriction endonuclease S subunit